MVSPSILHTSSLLPGGGNPETVAKTPWQYCNLCLPYSKQARTNQSTISLKLSDQKCFLFQSSQQPTEDFFVFTKVFDHKKRWKIHQSFTSVKTHSEGWCLVHMNSYDVLFYVPHPRESPIPSVLCPPTLVSESSWTSELKLIIRLHPPLPSYLISSQFALKYSILTEEQNFAISYWLSPKSDE